MHKVTGRLSKILSIILGTALSAVFFMAAWAKVSGNPGTKEVFTTLEMEPHGRIIIGIIEAAAAFLLVTHKYSATGALLGFAVMIGAFIAHGTKLGFVLSEADGGFLSLQMLIAASLCLGVMWLERHDLPIVGKLFDLEDERTSL